jgi:hypothetical protein
VCKGQVLRWTAIPEKHVAWIASVTLRAGIDRNCYGERNTSFYSVHAEAAIGTGKLRLRRKGDAAYYEQRYITGFPFHG